MLISNAYKHLLIFKAYGIVWKAFDKEKKKIVAVKKIYDAFRNRTDAQVKLKIINIYQCPNLNCQIQKSIIVQNYLK